jgi:hypothetical protein
MGFKSHIWKKKHRVLAGSRPSHGLTRRVDRVWPVFWQTRTDPAPGLADPLAGMGLITMQKLGPWGEVCKI